MTIGSRAQVMHGTATETSGGLKKKDLKRTDDGRIVSKKQVKALNPKLKAWSEATKTVMDGRKSDKFVALKKGSATYKKVKKEYNALVKKRGL
jgi:hypothetical protein